MTRGTRAIRVVAASSGGTRSDGGTKVEGPVRIDISGRMSFVEAVSAAAPGESVMGAVVVGTAAAEVRRSVGPVAWCALEYLAASPPSGHGDEDTVAASVRSLAVGLGVNKNTAHRALSVLRAAGLVEPMQSRCEAGRFGAGCYRLGVSSAVVARVGVGARECTPPAAPSTAGSVPGRARARRSRTRRDVEQLSLLLGV